MASLTLGRSGWILDNSWANLRLRLSALIPAPKFDEEAMPSAGPARSTEELGTRIRRLRSERGLAQERLAIEAHVDQSGLSKFERGKDRRLSRESLERIAKVLGVSYQQLVEGTTHDGTERA